MTPKHAVSLIEAAYRLDLSTTQWLEAVAAAASEALESKHGAIALQYDASSGDWTHIRASALHRLSPAFAHEFFSQPELAPEIARHLAKLTRSVRLSRARDLLESTAATAVLAPIFDSYGVDDMLTINGPDPSGRGCLLMVATSHARESPRTIHLWHRLAAHVAAGNRLRSSVEALSTDGVDPVSRAEAVLSPNGNVDHATGAAEPRSARQALRDALVRIDQARSVRDDAHESVELWRGLVAGRWSLVEHFERGGRRYYLAHKNDPELAPDRALTQRECQVLGYAELGSSNKLIAYALGLSSSSVSTLLTSARRKLGASKPSDDEK